VNEALATLLGPPAGYVFALVWGAVWGSFYNVVIVFGEGRRASLVRPGSHCLACGTPIRFYDNIPILSYLILRGRCRACGARFSPRYVIVEVLAALLAVALYWRFVVADVLGAPFVMRLAWFLVYEKLAGLLLVLSAIDLTTLLIPDKITYPSIPVMAALSLLLPLPRWWDGLVGAVAGYAVIWIIAEVYYLVRRREGMGLGDAKLLAMIGAALGWRALPFVIFLASLQGSVLGIVGLLTGARLPAGLPEDEPTPAPPEAPPATAAPAAAAAPAAPAPAASLRFAAIPFGPFLAVAALEYLFLAQVLRHYLAFFWL
jgi:leader peptidase (prepilin peptidase)/N-methyltransferase